ncbi:alpha/beta hydrolase [Amycolatopsis sp. PS_44_ISF1]|uniref:alpha/beta fold hydrolase n=1 Tax=Amycolatopsis sp. PS_44_ISF1 TaxID=2974917 RepID=UPI0028DE42A6|nr:alpha/beta hydrolase [Amycolatopsis sp. PS_44_ISF1]MDT8914114.1 alpha/beta hydrolase [Amycolatopsis sp. PS_44_ISF1]
MTSVIRHPPAVLLPGTGSDEVFVRSVFAGPLAALGIPLIAVPPVPGAATAECFLAELDRLADRHGTLLVGGISFGAHLSAEWAVAHPGRCGGLLAALPAWNGEPGQAPASLAAKLSADFVAASGVAAALAQAEAGSPPWLAAELRRSWRRHGDGLADGLRAAATRPAPTPAELRGLSGPAGIGMCADDPIHPADVAREWAGALPRATVGETSLAALGADRESLGRATVLAYLRATTAS